MRKKLLLADDSITIQKVVELTFPSDEFEVVTAGNGRIAVDKAMTFLPDVVLCDVIMPQLDGYQVCEALRATEALKNVPILLLNGAFEPYDAERAKAVGALGNVSKPFDPPALVARVKEILSERSTSAFSRPSLDALAVFGNAVGSEEPKADVPESAPHEYTYDESETHPVSTVEVPMDIRELAARSLSLDAPVFAVQQPDVLTSEGEPSDFSETLHGPLDADLPVEAEMEAAAEPLPGMDEIEAIEEMEPALTGEIAAAPLKPPAAPVEEPAEPMEFDPDIDVAGPEAASAAPAPAPAPPVVEEFSGEHEFEPEELSTPITQSKEIPPPAPSVMPMEAAPAPAEADPADTEPAALPVIALPMRTSTTPRPVVQELPKTLPPSTQAGAFDGLVGPASVPVPVATPAPAAAPMPSAEVAVPVDMVQQIAQRVISQVSERVIREIAWDVIPGLAEKLIKAEIERIKARAESESD
jgi:CheY-like chemotaxis protein